MKYCLVFLLLLSLSFSWCSCNNGAETKESAKDTTLVSLSKTSQDSLNTIIHINDSMNLAITGINNTISELQDSADNVKNNNPKKDAILDYKTKFTNLRDEARTIRNNLTSQAIVGLTQKLSPLIDNLKKNIASLQKLAERVKTSVDILTLVDKALTSAITGGIIKPPVVLPAEPAS